MWCRVGIRVPDELRHGALLFGGLGVLFADVPIERQLVAEAGDQARGGRASVRVRAPPSSDSVRTSRPFAASAPALGISAHVVVDLLFLKLEVEVQPLCCA